MEPSVGRIVHYVSHGTPVRDDGTQEFTSECRAAIITEVEPDPFSDGSLASLCVFNPAGQYFTRGLMQDEGEKLGGTWHWPERVGDS